MSSALEEALALPDVTARPAAPGATPASALEEAMALPEPGAVDKAVGWLKDTAGVFGRQVRAADRAAYQALGGPQIEGLLASVTGKTVAQVPGAAPAEVPGDATERYRAGRDQANARAEEAKDQSKGGALAGQVGAAVLENAILGVGKIGTALGRAGANAALGAGSAALQSKGDLTKGETGKVAADAAIGAGASLAGDAAGGLARVTVDATREAVKTAGDAIMKRLVTKGADPTAIKRHIGTPAQSEAVFDLTHRTPALRKAVRAGDHDKIIEETDRVLDDLRPVTAPKYAAIDEAIGDPHVSDVATVVDDEIARIESTFGAGHEEGRIPGLKWIKERIVKAAKANGGKFTTEDLRSEVTSLIKQKQATTGSLAETSAFDHKAANHKLLDDFLNARLDAAKGAAPQISDVVDDLRVVNKDIAAALNLRQVAESVVAKSARVDKPITETLKGKVAKAITGGGIAAIAFGGNPVAAVAGAVAPEAVEQGGKAAIFALQDFGRKVRAGTAGPDEITAAIKAGVPRGIINQLLSEGKTTQNGN